MIITRTPFRVSFFGGGTDYRSWYRDHGALIISSTIEKYCYISMRKLPPFFECKTRVVYSKIEQVMNNKEIQHPSINQCLRFLGVDDGLEIHHDGDLPARSGIGSSSSFTVGFLNALHALKYEVATKSRLAAEAITVEQELIKESVGVQDQIITAHGGFNAIKINKDGKYEIIPLNLPPDYLREFQNHILIGFTGISRTSSDFAKEQIKQIGSGSSLQSLNEMAGLAEEAFSLLCKHSDMSEIGALLDKGWQIKRSLAKHISNPQIDELYEAAKSAGAYGGKLLGAGGGGFMMFMAPPETHAAIRAKLESINVWVPFQIDYTGSQVIFNENNISHQIPAITRAGLTL